MKTYANEYDMAVGWRPRFSLCKGSHADGNPERTTHSKAQRTGMRKTKQQSPPPTLGANPLRKYRVKIDVDVVINKYGKTRTYKKGSFFSGYQKIRYKRNISYGTGILQTLEKREWAIWITTKPPHISAKTAIYYVQMPASDFNKAKS